MGVNRLRFYALDVIDINEKVGLTDTDGNE
jgi:hypothetical protein